MAPRRLLSELEQPEFRINPPKSNNCPPLEGVALLDYAPVTGNPVMRFNQTNGQIEGVTPRASRAISEFVEVLADAEPFVVPIEVNAGETLFFRNAEIFHRRRAFDPGTDLRKARWMRRCYACQNPSNGEIDDRVGHPFQWR